MSTKSKEKVQMDPAYIIKLTVTLLVTCVVVAAALGGVNAAAEDAVEHPVQAAPGLGEQEGEDGHGADVGRGGLPVDDLPPDEVRAAVLLHHGHEPVRALHRQVHQARALRRCEIRQEGGGREMSTEVKNKEKVQMDPAYIIKLTVYRTRNNGSAR